MSYQEKIDKAAHAAAVKKAELLQNIFVTDEDGKVHCLEQQSVLSTNECVDEKGCYASSIIMNRAKHDPHHPCLLLKETHPEIQAMMLGVPTETVRREWKDRLQIIRHRQTEEAESAVRGHFSEVKLALDQKLREDKEKIEFEILALDIKAQEILCTQSERGLFRKAGAYFTKTIQIEDHQLAELGRIKREKQEQIKKNLADYAETMTRERTTCELYIFDIKRDAQTYLSKEKLEQEISALEVSFLLMRQEGSLPAFAETDDKENYEREGRELTRTMSPFDGIDPDAIERAYEICRLGDWEEVLEIALAIERKRREEREKEWKKLIGRDPEREQTEEYARSQRQQEEEWERQRRRDRDLTLER